MNRNELIEFLRDPSSLSPEKLEELEKVIADAPYFQSARMLFAKGSGVLNEPATRKRVASAAIYATDRPLLKKYMSGSLLFLTNPPARKEGAPQKEAPKPVEAPVEEGQRQQRRWETKKEKFEYPKPKESKEVDEAEDLEEGKIVIPGIPDGALDDILDELEQDMEDLKSSRSRFADLQQQIEEEDAVSAALQKATSNTAKEENIPVESIDPSTDSASVSEDTASDHMEDTEKVAAESPTAEADSIEETPEEIKETSEEIETTIEPEPPIKVASKEPEPEKVAVDKEETVKDTSVEEVESKTEQEEEKVEDEALEEHKEAPVDETPALDKDAPEIVLESEQKRLERLERREKREKRLSDLNTLSEKNLKKLEDQMWGDSDDQPVAEDTQKDAKLEEFTRSVDMPSDESKEKNEPEEVETKKNTEAEKTVTPEKKVVKPTRKKTPTKKVATVKKKATTKKTTTKTTAKKASVSKTSTAKGTSKAKKTTSTEKKDDNDDKGHPQKEQEQIIEKFIKESPSISKPTKDKVAEVDLSGKSAEWNKDLASEYLAEIYLNQGNKKRAIEIYEVLILNFPEKKSYFAELISKIK